MARSTLWHGEPCRAADARLCFTQRAVLQTNGTAEARADPALTCCCALAKVSCTGNPERRVKRPGFSRGHGGDGHLRPCGGRSVHTRQ